MLNTGKLAGKTLFITGASRGIGKAIAVKAAKDGANIVIAAKTAEPHPKLPGTIYTAAKEVEDAGGKCLPCVVDIRNEEQVEKAVDSAVKKFGGIDILINNASAIHLTGTVETPMKRYDLMHNINTRGTFLVSKYCVPYLKKSTNPHILNLSPPLIMNPRWFKDHVAYTMAKYGMSMCVLGMAEEFKNDGIAVNALWPKTAISTAAMEMLGGEEALKACRKPSIMSDAAYAVLIKDSKTFTGNFCIDEHILKESGVQDFDQYAIEPGQNLMPDLFLSDSDLESFGPIQNIPSIGTQQPSAKEETNEESEIKSVFNKIKNLTNEEMVKQTNGVFQFIVKDKNEISWYIDLKNGNGGVGQGDPPEGKADVTFTTDSKNFLKMFSGALKPTAAFMAGSLRIKGNMALAMKLDKLLSQLKAKL